MVVAGSARRPDRLRVVVTATAAATAAGLRGRVRRAHPAEVLLAVAIVVWIVTFAILVVHRHERFWSIDFDMGIHDQAIWLLAHGRGFITVRGLQVFGHHFTPDYLLFAPAYWLGAGPDFLNVLQVVALAAGAVPIYLLARARDLGAWSAAALAAAFLLHPALQFIGWELFHPEAIAITPLLCAYLCSVRRSWGWFAFWSVLALSCKEDVALVVVVLGLIIAVRGDRRVGLATAGCALAWFVVVALIAMPAINGGTTHAAGFLSGVGGSPGGIAETAVRDPGKILGRVFSSETGDFAWRLLVPFGFAPLLAPLVLALGLPQFLVDALSDVPWMRVITFHYAALPLTALAIGMVEGVALLARRFGRPARIVAPAVVLAGALFGTLAWGPSPVSAEYDGGWWPPATDTRLEAKQAAIDAVPPDADVSASYTLVPHLTHRAEIYSFPNPWRVVNWGVPGTPTRSPGRVDWLVIDRLVHGPADLALLEEILGSGAWTVVRDEQAIVVARRSG